MQSVDVLLNPVVSEKAVMLAAKNQYMFLVQIASTKGEIKKAIELYYGVDVVAVRTSKFRMAPRRQTKKRIENAGIFKKKAYISLKIGQTIEALKMGEA